MVACTRRERPRGGAHRAGWSACRTARRRRHGLQVSVHEKMTCECGLAAARRAASHLPSRDISSRRAALARCHLPRQAALREAAAAPTRMREPDPFDPTTVAYHEAGHAVVAHQLGGSVAEVSIEAGDDADDTDGDAPQGRTTVHWPGGERRERARWVGLAALGGPLAEARHRGEAPLVAALVAWAADWREVQRALAIAAMTKAAQRQLLARWIATVSRWLADPAVWESLCRVADALEAHGRLDGEQFTDAVTG